MPSNTRNFRTQHYVAIAALLKEQRPQDTVEAVVAWQNIVRAFVVMFTADRYEGGSFKPDKFKEACGYSDDE